MRIELVKPLKWEPWFCWYPLVLESPETGHNVLIWLETIERRWNDGWEYRVDAPQRLHKRLHEEI